jgi:hypothetical protein
MAIRLRTLETTSDIIDVCGGNKPFAKLVRSRKRNRSDQHASNYRRTNIFPPDTYLVVTAFLKKKGYRAPASLWGITDPNETSLRRTG